jgi:PAS domain S-box-containing protein
MLCILDTNGIFVKVNRLFCDTLGYEPDDLTGQPFSRFIAPTDQTATEAQARLIESGEVLTGDYENRYRLRSGEVIWLAWSARLDPETNLIYAIARDVTKRKAYDDRLRRLNWEIITVLESITDAFFALDSDWKFTYVNNEAERLLNYKRSELLGQNIWERFPEAVGTLFHRSYERVLHTQESAHFESFYAPMDTWFEVNAYPLQNGVSVYFRDITERKAMEDQLNDLVARLEERAEERSRELVAANAALKQEVEERVEVEAEQSKLVAILEATSDFVAITDTFNRVHYINQAGRRLLRLERMDVGALRASDFFSQEAREIIRVEGIPTALRDGVWSGETALLTMSGREIPVSQVIIAHPSPDGGAATISTIARDISQRKQIEDNLKLALAREQELSELKSRFASMVSHEFRTPLTMMMSTAELLINYHDRMTPEDRQRHVEKLKAHVQHLDDTLSTVLSLTHSQVARLDFTPSHFNIRLFCSETIEEVTQMMDPSRTVYMQVEESCPQHVDLDKKLLRQILINLLINAVKYTPNEEPIDLNLTCRDGYSVFVVRDRGIGIPPEDLEHIFTPFHRAGNVGTVEGSGIGLALTRLAVQAHGGTIDVHSQVGRGTTFTVKLPLSTSE